MAIHSPACWYALGEFLATPTDSVQHGVADYVGGHTASEGLDLLLAYVVEGGHSMAALAVAQRLVRVLADEAYDLRCAGLALTAAPPAAVR